MSESKPTEPTGRPISFEGLYHTGIVVTDLDQAREEIGAALSVHWGSNIQNELPIWTPDGVKDVRFHCTYSCEGPHRLELVQSMPGTVWDGGNHLGAHHLGWWADDLEEAGQHLADRGLRLVAAHHAEKGKAQFFRYYQAVAGPYIELVNSVRRAGLEKWLAESLAAG